MAKYLILDVDGTMTDGTFLYDADGKKYKNFGVNDSLALELFHETLVRTKIFEKVIVMTGDRGYGLDISLARLKSMRCPMVVYRFINSDKPAAIQALFGNDEVHFIGDDLYDMVLSSRDNVTLYTTSNAPQLVKDAADVVSKYAGGGGGLADILLMIMETHGINTRELIFEKTSTAKAHLVEWVKDKRNYLVEEW